jgi:hypothetical protein
MGNYIIGLGYEMTDMPLSFFKGMKVLKEEFVSDTYFIKFENGDSDMTFSIHQKEYNRVKIDLRDNKIDSIIGKLYS